MNLYLYRQSANVRGKVGHTTQLRVQVERVHISGRVG
jgi:hypothetical protein